ncbi:MAG: type II toxin-antitoxin system VapC family toxin [Opitutaceae bacterium]
MIYDTNFLIALQGRKKGITANEARAWAANDPGVLYVPRLVEMEFLAGFASDAEASRYLRGFVVLPLESAVLKETVRIMRELRGEGQGIGAADSIIAATARLYGLPLVTDNVRHFNRVQGLNVRNFQS